jgi:hypothetical protein
MEAYRGGRGRSRVGRGVSDALGDRVSLKCTTLHIVEWVYWPRRCVFLPERGGHPVAAVGTAVSERLRGGEVATPHIVERVCRPKRCVFLEKKGGPLRGCRGAGRLRTVLRGCARA